MKLAAVQYRDSSGNAGSIYTSTSRGVNWERATAPSGSWRAVTCDDSGQIIAAGQFQGSGSIYISTNGGVSWNAVTGVTGYWNSLCSDSTGQLLVAIQLYGSSGSSSGGNIYVTTSGYLFIV